MTDLDLVIKYATLAAKSGDTWHITNAQDHAHALEDGTFDRDAAACAIRLVSRHIARAVIGKVRETLAELGLSLDEVDYDAVRDIQAARSALFAAWSKLREPKGSY